MFYWFVWLSDGLLLYVHLFDRQFDSDSLQEATFLFLAIFNTNVCRRLEYSTKVRTSFNKLKIMQTAIPNSTWREHLGTD